VYDGEGVGQGLGLRAGRVAVPLAIGPFPEELPEIFAGLDD